MVLLTTRKLVVLFSLLASVVSAWTPSARRLPQTTLFDSRTAFSEPEQSLLGDLQNCSDNDTLMETLTKVSPSLMVKINTSTDDSILPIKHKIDTLVSTRMELAKETLSQFLEAGEIRKLDHLIGTAARNQRLDMCFFNVLQLNLQNANTEQAPILTHIYTRCQEELETTLPPGTAFLNRLLRTESPSIRHNLITHYLLPTTELQAPDGTTTLHFPNATARMEVLPLIEAMKETVLHIRNVQHTTTTANTASSILSTESAARMVEQVRTVAKEVRSVLGTALGPDSESVRVLESELEPVFRPTSADSIYIRGNQQQQQATVKEAKGES